MKRGTEGVSAGRGHETGSNDRSLKEAKSPTKRLAHGVGREAEWRNGGSGTNASRNTRRQKVETMLNCADRCGGNYPAKKMGEDLSVVDRWMEEWKTQER